MANSRLSYSEPSLWVGLDCPSRGALRQPEGTIYCLCVDGDSESTAQVQCEGHPQTRHHHPSCGSSWDAISAALSSQGSSRCAWAEVCEAPV